MFQHIDNEITGFVGLAKFDIKLPPILIDHATGNALVLGSHIVVTSLPIAPRFAPTGIVAKAHGCLTVEAQPHCVLGLCLLVFGLKVLKNQVRSRQFFWGLALTTGRKR